jgi:predicted CoA-binding protein
MKENEVAKRLERPDPLIAVVGATDSPGKYGGIIYRNLKAKGFRVVGVNPRATSVDGDAVFASLADLPVEPDIVDVVVPARIGLGLIDQVEAMEDGAIWFQPGAEDTAIRERLRTSPVPSLVDACIMVVARPRADVNRPGDH